MVSQIYSDKLFGELRNTISTESYIATHGLKRQRKVVKEVEEIRDRRWEGSP